MAKKQLTYSFYIGGKPVDELTPEQMDRMAERIGKAMSTYYTAHPDEYRRIITNDKAPKTGTDTPKNL